MLLGAYLLPGVVVAFPAGLLGQRFRDKTLGLAGLALMAISGLALSISDDFAVALVARTIGGVGATIVVLVATKMVTDWFDSREIVLAMSILQMSWPFGAMLALPIQAWIAAIVGLARGDGIGRGLRGGGALRVRASSRSPRGRLQADGERPRKTALGRADARDRRRHDLGRDESRLHPVLQLRAIAAGGAGIVADRRGVADQPRDLVHDPGHSVGRISRSPLGQTDRWRSSSAA